MTDRAATRRGELVAAAYKVFATKGYRTSGVADIVREAGVSHGTFYNYFDSKRHILEEVARYSVELIVDAVVGGDRPDGATTLPELTTQFRAMLGKLLTLAEKEPGLVQFVMFDVPAIDEELVQQLLTLFSTFGVLTTAYLDNGVERGFLRQDLDTTIISEGLLALMMSAVVPTLRGPLTDAERTRHIDALAGLAFNGVRAHR